MYKQYHISGSANRVFVDGESRQIVKLNADGFFKSLFTLPSLRCLDLLKIATGIFTVDRISKRKKRRGNEFGIRELRLSFEVRDIAFWEQLAVNQLLNEILSFLTDDDWILEFKSAAQIPGDLGHQDFLSLPRDFAPKHAALYSGGLDSAAGLANRFLSGENEFILMTVGHQSALHDRVTKQLNGLSELMGTVNGRAINFLHSTLTTSLAGGKAKRMRDQERTQRSRAFLFCSAAGIAAKAYGVDVVEMFENGIGAINLPLMTGMLGSGMATRGAHPTFLHLMSEFASMVTEKPMFFVLPFIAKTKGEMLQTLHCKEGLATWAQESRSCVHTSVREAGKTHCGRCPACIERRQAFAAADIAEDPTGYQTNIFDSPLKDQDERDYLELYRLDASKWLEEADSVRRRMINHLRLTAVPVEHDASIYALQSRHAAEVVLTYGPASISSCESLAGFPKKLDYENGAVP